MTLAPINSAEIRLYSIICVIYKATRSQAMDVVLSMIRAICPNITAFNEVLCA